MVMQQDLFAIPSGAPDAVAPAAADKSGADFDQRLLRRAGEYDLSEATVFYAQELVRLQPGLNTVQARALTLLVLATMIEQRRGSTRLPVQTLLADSMDTLQLDGGEALDGGAKPDRLSEILSGLIAPKNGPIGVPGTPKAPELGVFLDELAHLLQSGAASTLIGAPGDYRPLILDDGHLYHQRMLYYEDRLVDALRERIELPDMPLERGRVKAALGATLGRMPKFAGHTDPIQLNEAQRYALVCSVYRPLTVISGGPGTGKTSIVVSVLRVLARLGVQPDEIALAAPTGKAAHRLGESVKNQLSALGAAPLDPADAQLADRLAPARTLHRLLGFSPARNDYYYHAHNRLPHRVVIADEASMIDLFLMERLVSAVDPSARLILLGDADQLPSVDAGAVFRDLVPPQITARADWLEMVDAESAPAAAPPAADAPQSHHAVRLTTSYRMDPTSPAGGDILRAAQALNRGEFAGLFDPAVGPIHSRRDFDEVRASGVELREPNAAVSGVDSALLNGFVDWWYGHVFAEMDGFRGLIQQSFSFEKGRFSEDARERLDALFSHLSRAQVLTVTRVFATGSEQLNAAFHARHLRFLGPQAPRFSGNEAGRARETLAPGEPVIALQNDYERGLFNGDQGLILDVLRLTEDGRRRVELMAVFLRDGEFIPFALSAVRGQIEHAFALTIHKAQGSEFDRVGIVLPAEPLPLLTRELLYTGMTRSRRSVLLIGARDQIRAASENAVHRDSGVARKLSIPAQ